MPKTLILHLCPNGLANLPQTKSSIMIINTTPILTGNFIPTQTSMSKCVLRYFGSQFLQPNFYFWDDPYTTTIYFNQVSSAVDMYTYTNAVNPTSHPTNPRQVMLINIIQSLHTSKPQQLSLELTYKWFLKTAKYTLICIFDYMHAMQ